MSKGTIDGKQKFRKNRCHSKTTDFQRFAFEIWQEASTVLPKLHIICLINFLRKKIFLNRSLVTEFFWDSEWKVSARFLNIFRRLQRKFFAEKTFLFKKSCLFPSDAEISSAYSVETFWQDFQNCISIVQRSMIPGKICFFENVDFLSNSDLEQILFESFAATFRQLRENCNPSVHRNILNKNIVLFLTVTKFFRLRTLTDATLNNQRKLFCQFCQYGIQRIQRIDWMKFLSYKELELFYHFWTLNEKTLEFLPENFVTVVENVLACPGYVFPFFLSKVCKFYLSFLYFDWFSFIFGRIFSSRVCKTAL